MNCLMSRNWLLDASFRRQIQASVSSSDVWCIRLRKCRCHGRGGRYYSGLQTYWCWENCLNTLCPTQY